ncbi:hypothetical protein WL21_04765 [Burkholderia ubonensis]|nr:hypothetical protein WJ81_15735 [Burkholderia ubonensis]KVZ57315.1 hypothetical protein WL20_23520 [Burkholderia ubonensis]KVZ73012.1 hypothetical protein WL21_04765 [Burkholderia ubonensis]
MRMRVSSPGPKRAPRLPPRAFAPVRVTQSPAQGAAPAARTDSRSALRPPRSKSLHESILENANAIDAFFNAARVAQPAAPGFGAALASSTEHQIDPKLAFARRPVESAPDASVVVLNDGVLLAKYRLPPADDNARTRYAYLRSTIAPVGIRMRVDRSIFIAGDAIALPSSRPRHTDARSPGRRGRSRRYVALALIALALACVSSELSH